MSRPDGTETAPVLQEHYPEDFAHCYGCGHLNEHGLHVRSVLEGDVAVCRFLPAPYHIAMPGFVYGGLIASIIDCHAMGAAAAAAHRAAGRAVGVGELPRFVTGSLKVDYRAPTPVGVELEARARVRELKERKVVLDVELLAGGRVTATGEVVAVRLPPTMSAGG